MKKLISFLLRKIPRKYLQLFSHIPLKIVSILYRGNKYECPSCGTKYRKLLPYGRVESRANALCPSCLTLERHRLLLLFLKERTNFFTDKLKVLHVAPEYPFIERFDQLPNLDYITGDIESPLAKVKMDVHDIPFEENTFDAVICNHVLEHVESDYKVMGEFLRVLKPGGWAILQCPIDYSLEETYEDPSITDPLEREKAFGQDDHVRMYGRDYGKRLQKGGFEVTEDKFAEELGDLATRYCIQKEEIIYFCRKPLN